MAISILAKYPGQVGAATAAYPLGVARNVSASGANDGTPWEELLVLDIQGFLQGLLEQVPAGAVAPSGNPDTALVSQYIDSLKLIVQGLDVVTFVAAETNTALRLAPDGTGKTQWLANVAEELATANLDTTKVLTPDGLGGVAFNTIPGSGITNTVVHQLETSGTTVRLPVDPLGLYSVRVYAGSTTPGTLSPDDGVAIVTSNVLTVQTDEAGAVITNFTLGGGDVIWTIAGAPAQSITTATMYLTRIA